MLIAYEILKGMRLEGRNKPKSGREKKVEEFMKRIMEDTRMDIRKVIIFPAK